MFNPLVKILALASIIGFLTIVMIAYEEHGGSVRGDRVVEAGR